MKKSFSKSSYREKVDRLEKKASIPGASLKEKSSKRKLSIYDDFEDEELDDFDPKILKNMKSKR